eukprot:scaffold10931_cov75-Phaeocystis_antarctica.AAC.9
MHERVRPLTCLLTPDAGNGGGKARAGAAAMRVAHKEEATALGVLMQVAVEGACLPACGSDGGGGECGGALPVRVYVHAGGGGGGRGGTLQGCSRAGAALEPPVRCGVDVQQCTCCVGMQRVRAARPAARLRPRHSCRGVLTQLSATVRGAFDHQVYAVRFQRAEGRVPRARLAVGSWLQDDSTLADGDG